MDSINKTTNYFNIDTEFFLIDSNNLDSVKSRFYGYSIQDTGIYKENNLDEKAIAGLDGCGCYTYIKAESGKITIQQDFNGSYGIYLYQSGKYFALNSSFYMLMIKSGIDLNEIRVNTVNDDLHTHREDCEISSELAEHYNVKLNKKSDDNRLLYYSLEDIVNMSYHNKMGFHKEIYFRTAKKEDKVYRVGGGGGECVRNYWNYNESEFINRNINFANRYPQTVQIEMKSSIEHIIKSRINVIKEKFSITDDESKYIKSLFSMYFDEKIYWYAKKYSLSEKYFPLRHCMAILFITEVIRLIMNSGSCVSFKDNMDNAINLYAKCEKKEDLSKHEILKRYITARVDIRNTFKEDNDIEFAGIDDSISIHSPKWFCNNGKGYLLHSQKDSLDICFKYIVDGNLTIYLRAKDVRDENSNRFSLFVNYKSFRLNGQEMLSASKECSHDNPYKFECKVKDGDSIQAHIEWEPSQQMCLEEKKVEIKEKIIEKIICDETKCEELRLELHNKENDYLQAEGQCKQLKNSVSYRLGYALTNPIRVVRNAIKRR